MRSRYGLIESFKMIGDLAPHGRVIQNHTLLVLRLHVVLGYTSWLLLFESFLRCILSQAALGLISFNSTNCTATLQSFAVHFLDVHLIWW